MKLERSIVRKWLTIAVIALIFVEVIFPLLHIAIPGPLWTIAPPFPFERLRFSYEKELGRNQILPAFFNLFEQALYQNQIPGILFDPIEEVSALAWSRDGKYLLVASLLNRRLSVYDTKSWKLVGTIKRDQSVPGDESIFQFLPNQNIIITPVIHLSPPNTVSMQEWDPADNKIVKIFDSGLSDPVDNHSNDYSAPITISESKGGDFIAESTRAEKGVVLIFDTHTSKIIQKIHCGDWSIPDALAFSPDERTIAVGDCHELKLSFFDIGSGNLKYETDAPGRRIYNFMAYSPDGTEVATAASEFDASTVIVVRASDGSIVTKFPWLRARVTNLQWIGDHTVLTSYDYYHRDGSTARIWNVTSGKVVEEFGRHDMGLAVLDDNEDQMAIAFGSHVEIFRVTK